MIQDLAMESEKTLKQREDEKFLLHFVSHLG